MLSIYRCCRRLTGVSKHCLGFQSCSGGVRSTVHCHAYSSESGQVYDDAFSRSVNNPAEFWAEASEDIVWHKKWTKVLDDSNSPFTQWFVGGELNTCYNALDRHVDAGNGDQVAIIFDSPVSKQMDKITYEELLYQVTRLAGVLRKHGVDKGDRVLIYMPMIPQAIIAMLATARLGAIHSLVFGGFAAKELAVRIDHAEPKILISANCGIEPNRNVMYKPMLDAAVDMATHKPNKCIIYNRPMLPFCTFHKDRDLDWAMEVEMAKPVDCVPVGSMDPAYVLYTSGTTGLPKAVVRPSGGHAVVLKWSMWNIYGLKPKEVWWSASDLGWVVGHSYICYAPLLNGNTTIVYEGKPVGTPDPGVYFRILKEHDVAGMFVAPTAIRAIRREDPDASYAQKYLPLPKFRGLFVAGEHCDKETLEFARSILKAPILDNWWQTETGWAISSTCSGLNMSLSPPSGAAGKPVPGWNVQVLKKDFTQAAAGELGDIVVKLPLPPGAFSTLWKNEERFRKTYFETKPGYYDTMDAGYKDEEGYVYVMARSDDVINVAGHRLSTGAIEEAIMTSEDIAEVAVVGIPDTLKGQVPLGLCVLKHGVNKSADQVLDNVRNIVRTNIGPVAAFKLAVIVPKLPKTRAGKIARNTVALMAAGQPFKIPSSIEDADVYLQLRVAFEDAGFTVGAPE
ncbi:acyl-CoA synthetase short-chain family member 3, mitochondrial-like isoform X2 [Ostrea edulis]|uniref:acyl-CoA synthetase short-chain family member 3, mitochondrial-like isoform X2 n=1 Tax=Ostrea edulis TaxID=37623 RepID=UPI00209605DF|nr:acyl-CoA synthetase short-chain family member 3, mitochondrial-like isoform X2 [Ostrea edulis]